VVVFPPEGKGKVRTHPFHEVDPALKKYEELSLELHPDHNIQIWDTGYLIKERHNHAE
jgi:hypothetical protein